MTKTNLNCKNLEKLVALETMSFFEKVMKLLNLCQ